jgi:hypothetical protein
MYEIDNGVLNGLLEKMKRIYKNISTNRSQKAQNHDLNVRHIP